jgi:hypothetical protein
MVVPIEIFISYRRSDAAGHARALHRALREFFDTERIFFDRESIESGDDFPDRISDSVRECRVLLALVGPDWLSASANGKRRLDDPGDFVRQEIALALREGKKVIPVLFDDTPLPGRDKLPDLLSEFAGTDFLGLTGKTFEYEAQLQELVRLLAKVPGVSPARVRAEGKPGVVVADREKLAYLCDRSRQDRGAGEIIREHLGLERHRPFVLVVHGRVEELHHAFVERLRGFSLPRILRGSAVTQRIEFVDVFEPLPYEAGQPAFDRRMRQILGERFERETLDDDRDLLPLMNAGKAAGLIAVVKWRSSEIERDAMAPLQCLFDYWSRFPDVNGRVVVGCIVCLKYDKGAARGNWFSRVFSAAADPTEKLREAVHASSGKFGGDPRLTWQVLEELPSVTVADLDRWVEEVRALVGGIRINEDQMQAIIGDRPRPMQDVLPKLEELVTRH